MIKFGSISIADSLDSEVTGPKTYCKHCQKETEYNTQMSFLPTPAKEEITMLWLESAYCTECRRTVYAQEVYERNQMFIEK